MMSPLIKNEAYVTLVTSDSYVVGAGVLARSLRSSGTVRTIWCLAASKQLSQNSMNILQTVFDGVTEVDCIDSGDKVNLALLGRPELGPTFTKLHLWRLTQFKKVVFLDADTLVIKNIDDLFEREEFSACADSGWPDCFNSGVFVACPNEETFKSLSDLAEREGSFDGGDQGLLNSYFSSWSTGPSSRRIPFTYNLTVNASYSYAPAFARFKNDLKVIHFIGNQKPWTFYRLSDGSVVPHGEASNLEFIQMWWNVYDKLSKSLQDDNSLSLSFAPSSSCSSSSSCLPLRNSNEIIKVYPSNPNQSASSNDPIQFGINPESDFANYRIKWNADVERYFNSTSKVDKIVTKTNLNESLQANQQFLIKNLRHGNGRNYRILNGTDQDETFYDGRYYSDD